MNSSTLRHILLALLLLSAQLGASAHSLTHLQTQPDGDVVAGTCDWCFAYADLVGPAPPSTAAAVVRPRPSAPPPLPADTRPDLPQRLAYRSQAPPLAS